MQNDAWPTARGTVRSPLRSAVTVTVTTEVMEVEEVGTMGEVVVEAIARDTLLNVCASVSRREEPLGHLPGVGTESCPRRPENNTDILLLVVSL